MRDDRRGSSSLSVRILAIVVVLLFALLEVQVLRLPRAEGPVVAERPIRVGNFDVAEAEGQLKSLRREMRVCATWMRDR